MKDIKNYQWNGLSFNKYGEKWVPSLDLFINNMNHVSGQMKFYFDLMSHMLGNLTI